MNDISSTGSEPSDRAKQHPRTPLDLRTFNPPLASPSIQTRLDRPVLSDRAIFVAANHYDLTFLESTTNVRAYAKRAFGKEPNAKVGRDISVSIQQGRLFFEAAEPAPLQIRPLLVYYGVLSFARALTAAIKNVEISELSTPTA